MFTTSHLQEIVTFAALLKSQKLQYGHTRIPGKRDISQLRR
jgi:hypothetical protein